MVNLSNHHKISRSGKLHSVIDNGLKSCIFIKVDDLLTSGRKTFQTSTIKSDEPFLSHLENTPPSSFRPQGEILRSAGGSPSRLRAWQTPGNDVVAMSRSAALIVSANFRRIERKERDPADMGIPAMTATVPYPKVGCSASPRPGVAGQPVLPHPQPGRADGALLRTL